MDDREILDQFWSGKANVIRAFLEVRPLYEKLAGEVAYILERTLRTTHAEIAAVTSRAKTLDSFCAKAIRKGYKAPLSEINDIAGVRVVYLYQAQRHLIEKTIAGEFEVTEKIDKVAEADAESFGYGALHYLVRLGKAAKGARYDELNDMTCEIQVRTILQDAWAVVAHHLSYKQESDVPKGLRRKLNALSAVFENADDQFARLREERVAYKARVEEKAEKDEGSILRQDLNLDNLVAYLNWKLQGRRESRSDIVMELLSEARSVGYAKVSQLDDCLERTMPAVLEYERRLPPRSGKYAQVGIVRVALALAEERYVQMKDDGSGWFRHQLDEVRHLVKE